MRLPCLFGWRVCGCVHTHVCRMDQVDRVEGSELIPGSVKSAEGENKLRTQFKAPAEEVKLFWEELPSNPRFPSKTCSDQTV